MNNKSIFGFITIFMIGCGPDLSHYDILLKPQIVNKSAQKMLIYEIKGDPNKTAGIAIGALYSAFYKLKKDYEMNSYAPIARWPITADTPRDEWIGIFGLPISDSVTELPDDILEKYPQLKIDNWEYGKVAEILHIGSYSTEHANIVKLINFIENSGYEIAGAHEEEYLKGPGMFFKGNPKKYKTILRYPVQEK
jgi:hypothetical protein